LRGGRREVGCVDGCAFDDAEFVNVAVVILVAKAREPITDVDIVVIAATNSRVIVCVSARRNFNSVNKNFCCCAGSANSDVVPLI
jgi:hypothetical protein